MRSLGRRSLDFFGSRRTEPGQLKSLGTDAFVAFRIFAGLSRLHLSEQICDKSVRSRQKKLVSETCLLHFTRLSRVRLNVKGVAGG